MSIRQLIVAAAVAATLPAAFAQTGPGALRGEAYPAGVATQVRQDLAAYGAKSAWMPDYDFVAGEAGYVPHQHQYMEQNELKARAMGNRGASLPAAGPSVQGPQEIMQYWQAGG